MRADETAVDGAGQRQIKLRFPGRCRSCGGELPAGTEALWDGAAKAATCLACSGSAPIAAPPPAAGTSAQREYERRKAKREASIRDRHRRLGGVILALTDDKQSTKAWAKGAEGERRVARRLDGLESHGLVVLHDRLIPRSKANIDHLVVAPTGIYVIDAKHLLGRIERRSTGTFFRAGPDKLYVGGRDKTALVDGMTRQVEAVRAAVADLVEPTQTAIRPVLCFVGVELPLLLTPLVINGVTITWPKELARLVRAPGPLSAEVVAALGRRLDEHLRPA